MYINENTIMNIHWNTSRTIKETNKLNEGQKQNTYKYMHKTILFVLLRDSCCGLSVELHIYIYIYIQIYSVDICGSVKSFRRSQLAHDHVYILETPRSLSWELRPPGSRRDLLDIPWDPRCGVQKLWFWART